MRAVLWGLPPGLGLGWPFCQRVAAPIWGSKVVDTTPVFRLFSGDCQGGASTHDRVNGHRCGKSGSIPFFIQGTTSDPKFVPDVQGMVGSQLKGGLGGALGGLTGKNPSGNSPVDALGGLFGKKKKQ